MKGSKKESKPVVIVKEQLPAAPRTLIEFRMVIDLNINLNVNPVKNGTDTSSSTSSR